MLRRTLSHWRLRDSGLGCGWLLLYSEKRPRHSIAFRTREDRSAEQDEGPVLSHQGPRLQSPRTEFGFLLQLASAPLQVPTARYQPSRAEAPDRFLPSSIL